MKTSWLLPKSLRFRLPGDKAHKLAGILSADSDAAIYERLVSSWVYPSTIVPGGIDGSSLSKAWAGLDDFGSAEERMMAIDAITYLPDDILCKVDRAAMGVSLETRVPFLDHRVVEFAWTLPLHLKIRDGRGKWIVRQVLEKHVPRRLFERPKMGFAVPIDTWLRGPLREWADDLLSPSLLQRGGFFEPRPIHDRWLEHQSGRRNWQYPLWNVLMFQAWWVNQQT